MKELEWVDFLKRTVKNRKDVLVGIGDDCALVKIGQEKALLKSDLFIEGVHFRLPDMSFRTIGMRAIARVLSDIAACGGTPKFIGISLGLPGYIAEKSLREIVAGVNQSAKRYMFSFVGGDTSRAPRLFLDVWALATVHKCILRSQAKVGDYIFITGTLGARNFSDTFEPRLKDSRYLAGNFKVHAMIDISDGFLVDLYRILKESGKGALLYKEHIPVTHGDADYYRGEDYELLFTVDEKEPRLRMLKKRFYCVGRIMEKRYGYKMRVGSKVRVVEPKGYMHF
ncbi:MAG: thiamine-phosphate kinase [Candidatus Omnitrophota bacterium]